MQQQKIFEPAPGPRFPGAPSGRSEVVVEVVGVGGDPGGGPWTFKWLPVVCCETAGRW